MSRTQPAFRERSKYLLGLFKEMFPMMEDKIRLWGPFDKDAIKIETTDKKFYVFTYYNDKDWGFQTYKNYIDCRRILPKS